MTWGRVQRPSDRQVHPLCERAQDLCGRAVVLYESAAVISLLPQGQRVFAEALSKEAEARCKLAEARSQRAP
jgi:hypothetical protein